MPITKFLEDNAKKWPDDVALVETNPEVHECRPTLWREYELTVNEAEGAYRREITWSIFDEKANRVANTLINRGVKKGDKVGILMMNGLDWLPVYFGILKTGALAVPLNFRYDAEEIKYCIELADINVLFFGKQFISRIEEILDGLKDKVLFFFVGRDRPQFAEHFLIESSNASSKSPGIEINDDDDAAIYFSSGTTGFPKAILHKHAGLVHSAIAEQKHHGQTKDDVFLCIPPLYHTGAKMHWFGSLVSGGKAVLLRGTKPEYIIEAASDERCTIVWLLVPWAQDLLDAIERGEFNLDDYELDQWRLMHIGAQPVPPSLVRRWKQHFPNHEYDTNYGLSESLGPGCVHLGVENIEKVGAIGVPGYGWETDIVDENRNSVNPGEVGELAVKGPSVMECYYKNPEASKEVLGEDGWLYTGDMAKQDEDGFIYLVDRKKDVIISGGENIYPVQVEDFLHTMTAIKDVAVIGLPDKRLGEIAAAIIEVKEGYTCSEKQVREYCLNLPRYKRPVTIIFAEVPRNATGKIEKPKLREMYGGLNIVATATESN